MTLAGAISRLPPPESEWDGRVSLGIQPGAVTLDGLACDAAALDGLVAVKRGQAKGGDDKLGAAYLIGELGWELGNLLGGLWLSGWTVRSVSPASVAVSIRPVEWEADGDSGIAQTLDLALDPEGMTEGAGDPVALAQAMEGLVGGVIGALAASTGLPQAAQWRLIGDGLSGALLHQGRAQGRIAEAIALGRAILGDRRTRLHSRQTAFVEIVLPGETPDSPPRGRDWFRLRGGCCRFYTAEGESGEYCTTCVLRDREDQVSRLSRYLERTLAQAEV